VKNKVAFFSPLPPSRTGTADYAADLIPELGKLVDLEVFEKVPWRFDPNDFAAVIYQIGNNPYHAKIYETALQHPGIVVLHEANLHDLVRGMTNHQPERYLRELFYEVFGQEWDALGSDDIQATGQQPRTFSVLRRLLDRSRACIVHNRYTEGAVRMKGFRGPVLRVPHGSRPRKVDGERFRAQLGIGRDQPLIGIFGYLRPDKQVSECVGSFRMLADDVPGARMVIAGQPHPEVPLAERISSLGLEDKVRTLDFQALQDLDGYIAACDIVLNLRWPVFGESSGITARALGMGKTVIVSDAGPSRELPDDVCVKIPCDRYQDRVLYESMKWLVTNRDATNEIGTAAARWVAETCTWTIVAGQYADFLTSLRGAADHPPDHPPLDGANFQDESLRAYLARWVEPGTESALYMEDHRNRLIRTLQLTPPGASEDRILEMGCYLQITPALRALFGYGDIRGGYFGGTGSGPGRELRQITAQDGEFFECPVDLFDCERDPFPYPDGYFATVLCCELIEHLKRDPMRMMSEVHRVLKSGGILLLTTPNAASLRAVAAILRGYQPAYYNRYPDPRTGASVESKHEREYTPREIRELLTDAGFVVEHIETGPYGAISVPDAESTKSLLVSLGQPTDLRGDCIFAVGRKDSIPGNPRPDWLYDSQGTPQRETR
jgi:glycosyltransferase involved in cell wall biosynthesis/SAM-dependent methyltransferase